MSKQAAKPKVIVWWAKLWEYAAELGPDGYYLCICLEGLSSQHPDALPMTEEQGNLWIQSVDALNQEVIPNAFCPFCGTQVVEFGQTKYAEVLFSLCPKCGKKLPYTGETERG